MLTRRELFQRGLAGATLIGLPSSALALGADAQIGIGLLTHGGGYAQRLGAVEELMWQISKQTSIDVREAPAILDPMDKDLFRWPLLVWIGTGPVPLMSDEAAARLQRYLRAGGTLFIDDASVPGDDRFDASVRAQVARLWPDRPLEEVGNDHTIYRTFFLLEHPYGRIRRSERLEGVHFDDRSPILYGRNDLFGAAMKDAVGQYVLPVEPGGKPQRERALRLGLNLVMYATCLNYKRDQVHTTAILRRRRWRVDRPQNTR